MKFSLVALATLVGAAVADLDPIVIKVLSPYPREDGVVCTNPFTIGIQVLLLQQ